jgi:hypothetical protein
LKERTRRGAVITLIAILFPRTWVWLIARQQAGLDLTFGNFFLKNTTSNFKLRK